MKRTTTVAVVVTMLLALFAGAALARHTLVQCPDPTTPPSTCQGQDPAADEEIEGTPGDDKMVGGGGDDRMVGLKGKDTVSGGAGEDMLGGHYDGYPDDPIRLIVLFASSRDPGEDKFYGGPGRDVIFARECQLDGESSTENCADPEVADPNPTPPPETIPEDRARDIIDCGPGNTDFASFDKKPGVKDVVRNCERLKWTDQSTANKSGCAYKPWDNANVKCITGTKGDDKNLVDRDNPDARMFDNMAGKAGDDTLRARRGFDVLWGGDGNDTLYGGPGEDWLAGEAGNDTLDAGGGDDVIDAEAGGAGGEAGGADTISCGGGDDDWVWIDDVVGVVGADIDKSTGQPFTADDLTNYDPATDKYVSHVPHDPATAPAGCEYIQEGGESLGWWFHKTKRHKKGK